MTPMPADSSQEVATTDRLHDHKYIARRSHRKSRLGCTNCKSRRVKCDEGKPACSNCLLRSVTCSYLRSHRAPDGNGTSPSSLNTQHSPNIPDAASDRSSNLSSGNNTRSAGTTKPDGRPADSEETATNVSYSRDLELMYHYATAASEDLGGGLFWQSNLPNLSFQNHGILHMILALSALHLGCHDATKREDYLYEADRHYGVALSYFLSELNSLSEANARDLYVAAVLVCLITFARGPHHGQYLAFSDEGKPEWLRLLHGLKYIRLEYSHTFSKADITASIKSSRTAKQMPIEPAPDFRGPFQELRRLVEHLSAEEATLERYQQPLDGLEDCFVAHYEGPDLAKSPSSQVAFAWLYNLPEDFLVALQSKKPIALVIYAYYMVIIKELESQWLYRNWAAHVLTGIHKNLTPSFRPHLKWPAEYVGVTFSED